MAAMDSRTARRSTPTYASSAPGSSASPTRTRRADAACASHCSSATGHAVGASVRNFGHVFVSGVGDGEDLDCALRSRERWLELGARAGISVRESGTLVVARAEDELAVLEGAAADPRRGARAC